MASPGGVDARQDRASRPRRKRRRALLAVTALMVIISALLGNSIALFAPSDKYGYISVPLLSVDALVFRLTKRTVPEVDPSRYRLVNANRIVDVKKNASRNGIIVAQFAISNGELFSGWTFFKNGHVSIFYPSNEIRGALYIVRDDAICIFATPLHGFSCLYIFQDMKGNLFIYYERYGNPNNLSRLELSI